MASHLAGGDSIDAISPASGRSRNTIRNQIAAVMDKTGCVRQAALVSLLTRLVPRH